MKLFPPVREIVSVSDLIGYRTDNNRSWVCKPRSSWPRPSLTPIFESRGRKEKNLEKEKDLEEAEPEGLNNQDIPENN